MLLLSPIRNVVFETRDFIGRPKNLLASEIPRLKPSTQIVFVNEPLQITSQC